MCDKPECVTVMRDASSFPQSLVICPEGAESPIYGVGAFLLILVLILVFLILLYIFNHLEDFRSGAARGVGLGGEGEGGEGLSPPSPSSPLSSPPSPPATLGQLGPYL